MSTGRGPSFFRSPRCTDIGLPRNKKFQRKDFMTIVKKLCSQAELWAASRALLRTPCRAIPSRLCEKDTGQAWHHHHCHHAAADEKQQCAVPFLLPLLIPKFPCSKDENWRVCNCIIKDQIAMGTQIIGNAWVKNVIQAWGKNLPRKFSPHNGSLEINTKPGSTHSRQLIAPVSSISPSTCIRLYSAFLSIS